MKKLNNKGAFLYFVLEFEPVFSGTFLFLFFVIEWPAAFQWTD